LISRRGAESVREVFSAKPIYENALGKTFQKLVVMTNASSVDDRAKRAADASDVEIISRKDLGKMMLKYPVTQRDVSRRLTRERLRI
jgi:hypothetical protein